MSTRTFDPANFMRVARALAVQDSKVLRCYARAGKVLVASSSPALDEALGIVTTRNGMRVWRAEQLERKRERSPAA